MDELAEKYDAAADLAKALKAIVDMHNSNSNFTGSDINIIIENIQDVNGKIDDTIAILCDIMTCKIREDKVTDCALVRLFALCIENNKYEAVLKKLYAEQKNEKISDIRKRIAELSADLSHS